MAFFPNFPGMSKALTFSQMHSKLLWLTDCLIKQRHGTYPFPNAVKTAMTHPLFNTTGIWHSYFPRCVLNCYDSPTVLIRLRHLQVTCSPMCFTWLWPTDCLMQQEYGTEHSSPEGVAESVQLKYLLAFQSRKPSLSLLTPQQPSWKVKHIAFMYNYHVI